MPQIIPTAEPFFFPGKGANAKIGCLVTHGFTGAPKEMRWLGEYLNAQGYTVCGIRLNGHATKPEDMIRSRWQDWLLSVEDGYNLLRSCTDQVFLLGLSMGGVLSLIAASRLPVRGVVAMSTPLQAAHEHALALGHQVCSACSFLICPRGRSTRERLVRQGSVQTTCCLSQESCPFGGGIEHIDRMKCMTALPQVKVPVLLIHSRDDDYVIRDSMEKIHAALGSTDKQMLWVEGGGHVITEEPTREMVFKAAADFIKRVSSA